MVIATWSNSLAGISYLMMFGQLSSRESLSDLIVAFEAHRIKQYHLGLGRNPIAKSTLAYANQNRDYRTSEDYALYIMKEAYEKRAIKILEIPGKKYAFDSTTISLCLTIFPRTRFRSKKKKWRFMSYMNWSIGSSLLYCNHCIKVLCSDGGNPLWTKSLLNIRHGLWLF